MKASDQSEVDHGVKNFLSGCEVSDLIGAASKQAGGLRQLEADLQEIIKSRFEEARQLLREKAK